MLSQCKLMLARLSLLYDVYQFVLTDLRIYRQNVDEGVTKYTDSNEKDRKGRPEWFGSESTQRR